MKPISLSTLSVSRPAITPTESSGNKKSKMLSFFGSFAEETQNKPNEFDHYLDQPQLLATEENNPLDWWNVNKSVFPTLAKLAQKYLAIPASSVPSEWLFSDAENHVTLKQNKLDPDMVNYLVFLKHNMSQFDIFSSC